MKTYQICKEDPDAVQRKEPEELSWSRIHSLFGPMDTVMGLAASVIHKLPVFAGGGGGGRHRYLHQHAGDLIRSRPAVFQPETLFWGNRRRAIVVTVWKRFGNTAIFSGMSEMIRFLYTKRSCLPVAWLLNGIEHQPAFSQEG